VIGIVGVALADFRERSRTFGIFVVVVAALQLGFLFVPDASATYATVNLGGWRGIYNSAWMGATTAMLTVTLLPLAGFFLVRPALYRDVLLSTAELVACAPIGRVRFVLGKFVSDLALLAGVGLLLIVAAVAMQFVRDESRALDVAAYVLPYVLVTLPTCFVVAAGAIVIDSIRQLRGMVGGVVWFVVWNMLLVIPVQLTEARGGIASFDPLGFTTISDALLRGLRAAAPSANLQQSLSVGVVPNVNHPHTYRFDGIPWTWVAVLPRVAWAAAAVVACLLVAPFALDFSAKIVRRRNDERLARLAARLPLPPLGRAELAQAFGIAGTWWALGAIALAVLALVVPGEALARGVAPVIWIWPVGSIAALSVLDARTGFDDVLRATPTPAYVRVLWRCLAALALTVVPIAALAVRYGSVGFTIVTIAFSGVAVGIALGTFTRSPIAFEAFALMAWYLGPVNRVPFFDPANAIRTPLTTIATAFTVGVAALTAATIRSASRN